MSEDSVETLEGKAGEWWEKAEEDLETARKNFEIDEFKATALFLHQSVEKV